VNPSPPAGARREAKQHQAATAKSEEGGETGVSQQDAHGKIDTVNEDVGAHGTSMTRSTVDRRHHFTAIQRHEQVSAWTLGLEWGGGIGLMALALALGFTTLRPTPRRGRARNSQPRPAPAWVRRSR
jgi:hypothetical protein